jgi:Ca2+-binding EF-hand superfamily protein
VSDYHKAFQHYDNRKEGKMSKAELAELLKDAGVGNWLTRSAWADGIISELDTDKDGSISAAELEAVLH